MRRLLLLPGLGDVHWVMLKLQDWLRRHGPEWNMPEVWIWNIDKRPRTLDYLDYVPFVRKGGYSHIDLMKDQAKFNSLYMKPGTADVIYDFHGFDALIGTNGNMRNGVPFSKIMGGAAVNYSYGPVLPPCTYGAEEARKGPYFVLCFSSYGMFGGSWIRYMHPHKIRRLLKVLKEQYPAHRFLFTGCAWDQEFTDQIASPCDEVLVGDTPLLEFLSLLQHSSGYIGWCGGNAILAQHIGVPTVCWWSRHYFPSHDRTGWQTPHGKSKHLVLEVEDYQTNTAGQIISFLESSNAAVS